MRMNCYTMGSGIIVIYCGRQWRKKNFYKHPPSFLQLRQLLKFILRLVKYEESKVIKDRNWI